MGIVVAGTVGFRADGMVFSRMPGRAFLHSSDELPSVLLEVIMRRYYHIVVEVHLVADARGLL